MIRHRAGLPAMDKSVYNTQEKVRELYIVVNVVWNFVLKTNVMMIFVVGELGRKQ